MDSDSPLSDLASFASYVCLLYHEARNVRHLITAGVLGGEQSVYLLHLRGIGRQRGRSFNNCAIGVSSRERAGAACDLFAHGFQLSLEDLVDLFGHGGWRHSAYGGNRWHCIARCVLALRHTLEAGEAVGDLPGRISAMSHNTGEWATSWGH
jgi:hypothetical protein